MTKLSKNPTLLSISIIAIMTIVATVTIALCMNTSIDILLLLIGAITSFAIATYNIIMKVYNQTNTEEDTTETIKKKNIVKENRAK